MNLTLSNLVYEETDYGLEYYAAILNDGKVIGHISNEGRYTNIHLVNNEGIEEFCNHIRNYFVSIGMNPEGVLRPSLYYTYAEHLIDIHKNGKLSDNTDLIFYR